LFFIFSEAFTSNLFFLSSVCPLGTCRADPHPDANTKYKVRVNPVKKYQNGVVLLIRLRIMQFSGG
jgi:hypothetical protein